MRLPLALLAPAILLVAPAAARAASPARSKLLSNTTGKTVIRKVIQNNDMTVAVISRSGTAAVCDPMNMPPGLIPDVVAITHGHHVNKAYLAEVQAARPLVVQTGTWTVGDLRVTGIAGAHAPAPVKKNPAEMVTYLFEADGLRIAYFSCNGQQQLEPEQVAALGKVDVALITVENGSGLSSAHARDLMKQLGARIVVPLSHHEGDVEYNMDIMAELAGGKLETVNGELALDRADLRDQGQRVIHILPSLAP
jgi:L-ascorbate metabolism protein UlaG (beta-lactamase superfamily)